MTLWNGWMRPEDATAEFVQSLSIPEAIKFLAWTHKYVEEKKKGWKFTLVGYDKDNDVFVEYVGADYFESVERTADNLLTLMLKNKLTNNGEPIDWLEIYEDYNGNNSKVVWATYELRED